MRTENEYQVSPPHPPKNNKSDTKPASCKQHSRKKKNEKKSARIPSCPLLPNAYVECFVKVPSCQIRRAQDSEAPSGREADSTFVVVVF